MDIAVITITEKGDEIALILKEHFNIHIFSKYKNSHFDFKCVVKNAMENYEAIIFITSTGIAVRGIGPYIKSKEIDPAVITIDNSSKFVISLLSGHLGGANDLTSKIANILGAVPVITTATDNLDIVAPDMIAKNNYLGIGDLQDAKRIASLLVRGRKVYFCDEENKISIPNGYESNYIDCEGIVYVTNKININSIFKDSSINLKLIRKNIVLGIGCRKDFPGNIMKETVLDILKSYNIDYRAVKSIGTVEIKKNEEAILKLSEFLKCKLNIFSIEEIKKIQYRYVGSDFVEKSIGVRNVCEPCVELQNSIMLTEKLKLNGMTLCIGVLKN
ncbi:cobalt-precorrin 5A hydrolase [Clostridium rectalis]|uniref:cobalt-precorrin 5A hydrolase n=1 Tax=Clostridium rectalis TaxID=2040295 RepID=UPI000F635570|nr:cobalt-precorrin 5A hydrolase [Clostridium rectalis]